MYLHAAQPIVATKDRILIVSEESNIQEDLRINVALQYLDSSLPSSEALKSSTLSPNATRSSPDAPELCHCENETQILTLVEAAAADHRPFALIIIDARSLQSQNKDSKAFLRRLGQVQRDLYVVLHSASQISQYEQLPLELGFPNGLIILKYGLAPFEMGQLIRTLTARNRVEKKNAHRDFNNDAQMLDLARRFEDATTRLRSEQEHRRSLEERLCRAQRLETVGRLADGVAHFFNNQLTVMHGHLSIALSVRDGSPRMLASLEELMAAAKHAAEITGQLVTFNHREYLKPSPISLEQAINSEAVLIKHVLGAQIQVDAWHEPGLPSVMADPACLGQILLDLAAHAHDAMPNGGRLSLHTHNFRIGDESEARRLHPEARQGHFVVLKVTDTGKGLKPRELEALFEPANTPGCQLGEKVGLLLVQGLVRHQSGWIDVKSTPDVGTEFSIYFPVADVAAGAPADHEGKLIDSYDESATILVVDDEDSVRQVMEYALTSQGHNVLVAKDASEAWQIWCRKKSFIKLAIVDVQLPGGASGFDLEKALCDDDPSLPVVFTCGYAASNLKHSKELVPGENFLPKPFGMKELLIVVGNALLKPTRL